MTLIIIDTHDSDPIEVESIRQHPTLATAEIELEDGTEWVVAEDYEAASDLVREYWRDMAKNDVGELREIIGDPVLAMWALGHPAEVGDSYVVENFEAWVELAADQPHGHLASYDGDEQAVTVADGDDGDLPAELGFFPSVAYRRN